MTLTHDQKARSFETFQHIHKVQQLLAKVQEELAKRALYHDQSKLESPEVEIFSQHTREIAKTVYGTPEYFTGIEKLGPALEHHYANNSHHPQHHPEGIDGMNLVDLIEMLGDWYASTLRYKDGDIQKSLVINKERFGISDQLVKVLRNTLILMEEK